MAQLSPIQDGHQSATVWADGTVGLVLFLGGAGLLYDVGSGDDPLSGLSLDLTLVTGTLGPHSGTLSVYIVDEADPAPFSVSRLPGDLSKTLLSSESLSGLPSNSSIPHTVDLGSPTMLPGWAGKIALVVIWLASGGQNVGMAATESGFPALLSVTLGGDTASIGGIANIMRQRFAADFDALCPGVVVRNLNHKSAPPDEKQSWVRWGHRSASNERAALGGHPRSLFSDRGLISVECFVPTGVGEGELLEIMDCVREVYFKADDAGVVYDSSSTQVIGLVTDAGAFYKGLVTVRYSHYFRPS